MFVLWGLAITLLLVITAFSWFVAAPFLRVRHVMNKFHKGIGPNARHTIVWKGLYAEGAAVQELGGPRQAVRLLNMYVRAPDWLASHKVAAVWVLRQCGQEAVPVLIPLLRHEQLGVREIAAGCLANIGEPVEEVVPALTAALEREIENDYMVIAVCDALGSMRQRASSAIPALERASRADFGAGDARIAVAEALRRVKGELKWQYDKQGDLRVGFMYWSGQYLCPNAHDPVVVAEVAEVKPPRNPKVPADSFSSGRLRILEVVDPRGKYKGLRKAKGIRLDGLDGLKPGDHVAVFFYVYEEALAVLHFRTNCKLGHKLTRTSSGKYDELSTKFLGMIRKGCSRTFTEAELKIWDRVDPAGAAYYREREKALKEVELLPD
jgi:hypothetical protein